MKIAFDGRPIMYKQFTGIGTYTDNIIRTLIREHKDDEFIINIFNKVNGLSNIDYVEKYNEYDNCKLNESSFNNSSKIIKAISWLTKCPYSNHFDEQVDITHFFNYVLPIGARGKSIVTIHDLVFKVCPETMNWDVKKILGITLNDSAQRADMIATISQNSKDDIVKYLKVRPEKIFIAPPAADNKIFHNNFSESEISQCKAKYGIKGNYFLYTGTLEPRKNLGRLIQAYASVFKNELKKNAPILVICGRNGWKYQNIYQQVIDSNIENKVMFTGYVPVEDVALLMNGTMGFVFPSLYEGFGMPPLEAMACGAPIITSNISSLPEVVGSAAVLINPHSTEELAGALKKIYNDEELRKKMKNLSLEQCKKYSWENSAGIIMDVYKSLI